MKTHPVVEYTDATPIATVEKFKAALRTVAITETDLALLRAQYTAPEHTLSPAQMAKEMGWSAWSAANLVYGALAHRIADALHYQPGPFDDPSGDHWWFTLSYWNDEAEMGDDNQWIMRPELVQALDDFAAWLPGWKS
jgi:predicted HNH restriction endonuclease